VGWFRADFVVLGGSWALQTDDHLRRFDKGECPN
jgi:hypothetical protein